jgi:hypothetical protein
MTPTQVLLVNILAFLALLVLIALPFAACLLQNRCN